MVAWRHRAAGHGCLAGGGVLSTALLLSPLSSCLHDDRTIIESTFHMVLMKITQITYADTYSCTGVHMQTSSRSQICTVSMHGAGGGDKTKQKQKRTQTGTGDDNPSAHHASAEKAVQRHTVPTHAQNWASFRHIGSHASGTLGLSLFACVLILSKCCCSTLRSVTGPIIWRRVPWHV